MRRVDALTAPTHRDALRVAALAGDDGVTASGLSSDLKATRAHMLNVLNDLEAQGFLRGTPAKGKRKPGIATVYCIQPVKVRIALDGWRRGFSGRTRLSVGLVRLSTKREGCAVETVLGRRLYSGMCPPMVRSVVRR